MQQTSQSAKLSRRQFLGLASAALAFPYVIPASALGRDGQPAPSARIALGAVGCGNMGTGNINSFLALKNCQVIAACDVDRKHVNALVRKVNDHYQDKGCKAYHDYRELMARTDIDAVMIAVPDHWHALVPSRRRGTRRTFTARSRWPGPSPSSRPSFTAVQDNERIWQTGSWQRSVANFHKAAEIVRNGLIGKDHARRSGLPAGQGNDRTPDARGHAVPATPPPELDYDTWIGPSKWMPYIRGRVHGNWRWNYNTGGGQLMDWVGHHCDIAHWGLGFDNAGPLEMEGHGEFPPRMPSGTPPPNTASN